MLTLHPKTEIPTMVIVKFQLFFKNREARSGDLYATSMTAAKQLLSRKIPLRLQIYPKGKWKASQQGFTRTFTNTLGACYVLHIEEVLDTTSEIPASPQLTFQL